MRCLEFIECYDESFSYAEDYELWARLIFQENLKGENLSEKLFEYRIFAGQSSAVHQEKQFEASAKIFDKYRIIPEESREVHKDLFFIHKSQKSKIENKSFKMYIYILCSFNILFWKLLNLLK